MATTTGIAVPHGRELLRDPRFNHGTAFTPDERVALGLEGLLPAGVMTLEDQVKRANEQYGAEPTNLERNEFLAALRDRNEVLYYRLLGEHLKEMLPVVYDPVVAQAIERYSHEYQRPDGVAGRVRPGRRCDRALQPRVPAARRRLSRRRRHREVVPPAC